MYNALRFRHQSSNTPRSFKGHVSESVLLISISFNVFNFGTVKENTLYTSQTLVNQLIYMYISLFYAQPHSFHSLIMCHYCIQPSTAKSRQYRVFQGCVFHTNLFLFDLEVLAIASIIVYNHLHSKIQRYGNNNFRPRQLVLRSLTPNLFAGEIETDYIFQKIRVLLLSLQ